MESLMEAYEDKILNGIWIGLLSIEALMVLGVAVQGVVKRYGPRPRQMSN